MQIQSARTENITPESPQEDQKKSHEYQVSDQSNKSDQHGIQGPEMTKNGSDIENAIEPQ